MPIIGGAVAGGGALLGGGLGVLGGKSQAGAAKSAARAQLEAAKIQADTLRAEGIASRQFLKEQADVARADVAPFRKIGLNAYQQAFNLAQADNNAVRSQASKAISNRLASQGLLRSGAFGQNLVDLESNLSQNRFNQLAALSGAGTAAAGQQAQIASNLGAQSAQNQLGTAGQISSIFQNATAQAGNLNLGAAQAQAQGLLSFGNSVNAGIGNALQFYYLNKLFPSGTKT